MTTISDLESKIRDIINNPRKQHALLQNTAAWNMLCSCLDVIGDTELSFDAYLRQREVKDNGEKYLLVYGALQALFIQQDAVKNLAEALSISYDPDPLLEHIREIRNDSVGHPTKRGGGVGRAFNFIVRVSLSHHGFTLMTTYPDGRTQFLDVSVPDLINKQRATLTKALADVVSKLEADEMEHRHKFKDERLQDIFPSTMGYYFEKISGACYGSELVALGAGVVGLVLDCLEKFKAALQVRGTLKAYDSVTYYLDLIEYPLTELKKYFENSPDSILDGKSAYIFAFFAHKHIEMLQQIAKEIDEEYASEP
jgi:hypothetical protein